MRDAPFHDALDNLPEAEVEAYVTVDADGAVTSWSPGAQQLLGYAADEIRGQHGTDLLYEQSDAARLAERCRAGQAATLGRVSLRHRDGRQVEAVLRAQPLVPTTGEPQWLVLAQSADAVRRQNLGRALLRGLFTESPFHIDVFDAQLRFVAQNARRLTGFRDQDVIGRTMRE
ncbi:PAS domain-containing protein, partial [Streptomyces diastatochromogenes]|uniref:PAS domain-containing protein n=1 Tax=Streptomyces diastatochromogenes TaxID=42236 RepID=UPI00117DC2C8